LNEGEDPHCANPQCANPQCASQARRNQVPTQESPASAVSPLQECSTRTCRVHSRCPWRARSWSLAAEASPFLPRVEAQNSRRKASYIFRRSAWSLLQTSQSFGAVLSKTFHLATIFLPSTFLSPLCTARNSTSQSLGLTT